MRTGWKWLSFFSRAIILNLVQLLNIKFRERLLELNLLHRKHVSLWITLKGNFSKENKPLWIWFRYIDDIFFIWAASEKKINKFLNDFNSFQPNLRLAHAHSKESLHFLDVIVKIQQGEFIADIYCKSTNGHQFLPFDSCHASHQLCPVKPITMKRICSRRNNLTVYTNKLNDWCRERSYLEEIVNKETKRSLDPYISSFDNKSKKNTLGDRQKGIFSVVTYNPFLCHLSKTIRKNLFLLYQDEEIKRVFTPASFVSFCIARTLRTHLVRAKVYPLEVRLVGSIKCFRNHCHVCKTVVKADIIQIFVDEKFYKVNHRCTCSGICLVYPISCEVC